MVSFWCLYCQLWIHTLLPFSSVFIVNFGQINGDWVIIGWLSLQNSSSRGFCLRLCSGQLLLDHLWLSYSVCNFQNFLNKYILISYLKYVNNVLVNFKKMCRWSSDTNTYLQSSKFPAGGFLFKFNNGNDVVLVTLLLTLSKLHTLFSVSSVVFEQVSTGWKIKKKIDLMILTPTCKAVTYRYQET